MLLPVRTWAALLLILALGLACPALAAPPALITYQANLCDASGQPITGTVDVTFALYAAAEGGDALWTETHSGAEVNDGLLSVSLGSITPLGLGFDQPYWLGITIGTDPEMTPRKALTSAPYALRAVDAEAAVTATSLEPGLAAASLNGATGAVTMVGSAPVSVATEGQTITISSSSPAVTSLNAATGAVTMVGSAPVSVATDGHTITVSSDTVGSVTAGAGLSDSGTAGEPVLAVDFGGDGSAETAARGDHLHDSPYYQKTQLQTAGQAAVPWDNVTNKPGFEGPYSHIVTVAKSGAQYTSIQSAIDSIGRVPENDRYLVWVGPGVYEEKVFLNSRISIQGSGRGVTIIQGGQYGLFANDDCAISDLTVKSYQNGASGACIMLSNTGSIIDIIRVNADAKVAGGYRTTGIVIFDESNVRMRDVVSTATATGSDDRAVALYIYNGSSVSADRVTLEAKGGYEAVALAFYAEETNLVTRALVNNSLLRAQGGTFSAGIQFYMLDVSGVGAAWAIMRNSRLSSTKDALCDVTTTNVCHAHLAGCMFKGDIDDVAIACTGCYDENFAVLDANCQ